MRDRVADRRQLAGFARRADVVPRLPHQHRNEQRRETADGRAEMYVDPAAGQPASARRPVAGIGGPDRLVEPPAPDQKQDADHTERANEDPRWGGGERFERGLCRHACAR